MTRFIKTLLRCVIYPIWAVVWAVLIVCAVIIGTPLAIIFSLALAPFATIRWALSDDDSMSWLDHWFYLAQN